MWQANFRSLLGLGTPWLYSGMYAAYSGTRQPGAPYLLCAGFMVLTQLATMRLGAEAMGDA